ncbi:hypothetical protein NDI47_18975 [Microcoleus vaginatus GB1-A2]|uniref:hypothetical protein n=1 Tax=Microcoleus vaginatus TaxID=119532 RepID=UPI001683B0D1|nr:hypothetical protein [Microcoleus sp. FACHB-61]
MRLQSFLEAPEPSRAAERSQYSIPNTSKVSVGRSLFISVLRSLLGFLSLLLYGECNLWKGRSPF